MKYPTTYTTIIKAIEKAGICTSGLDEWNAPRNMREWRNSKGKKLVDQWYKTTTQRQRFKQFEDYCKPRTTVTEKNFEIVERNWLANYDRLTISILDRAYEIIKKRGKILGSQLGWELWGETTAVPHRGTGSHQNNKFCRPAGKILLRLKREGRVREIPEDCNTYWRAI